MANAVGNVQCTRMRMLFRNKCYHVGVVQIMGIVSGSVDFGLPKARSDVKESGAVVSQAAVNHGSMLLCK